MSRKTPRQYGLWESPISPGSLAVDRRLQDVKWDSAGGRLVWLEGRSGVGVLVTLDRDEAAPRDLTGDLSVRAEVGYGGGDFTVHDGQAFFVVHKTGRLFRQSLRGGSARPITPAFGQLASPCVSTDGRWIAYVHHDGEGRDRIAVVDSLGESWPQILTGDHDFYMQPRWSPDGTHLAWIAWDHPRMPWDGTRLFLAPVIYETGDRLPRLGPARVVAGGDGTAIFQPEFTADGRCLVYVSDETGWGQLWMEDLTGAERRMLTCGTGEYGLPAWTQDVRSYAITAGGREAICARSEGGFVFLERIDLGTGRSGVIGELAEYTDAAQLTASPEGRRVAFLASGSSIPPRVVVYDLDAGTSRIVARASGENIPESCLSQPEALVWDSGGGDRAHGLFYPPASDRFEGLGLPPLLVLVHGGPTGQVRAGWNSQAQFFATRGYGVLVANYRGSTGYGREYMLKLRGNWGTCDVEDCISGMRHLAGEGRIDPERTAIMGGSAGGFTVLHTMVTNPEVFTAGVNLYGVSNQFHLAAETHKFEERYLDSLLGPLPEAAALYRERSPLFHAEQIRRPLAIFQGDLDQVVPRSQSDTIVEALRRSGVAHIYRVYEGEGHGWRKRETIEDFYKTVEEFLRQHLIFS